MQTYEIQEATAAEKLESIGEHLDMLADEIDALGAQVADLDEAGVCTGTVYWREGTKLYANHGIDHTCPIHGEPEQGKRLRVYVGTNQEAQQQALDAIVRCRQKAELEAQIRHIEVRRGRVESAIAEAWHAAVGDIEGWGGMITIAIANNKGGTGKTTTAVTLATGLTGRGYRVLLVDTDAQGHVALYLGLEPADDVFHLLIAEMPIADCIAYANGHNRLAVVRSGEKTAVAKTVLGAQRAPVDVLARALDPLRSEVDFCLVDAAPSVDPLGLATLYVADYVLVPAKCETLSLGGIRRISSTILDLHKTYKATTRLLGVLPTMFRGRTREHQHNLQAMAQAYGKLVYPPVPQATAVAESTAYQEPLWTYAPRHPATRAYKHVLERMLSDVQEPTTCSD